MVIVDGAPRIHVFVDYWNFQLGAGGTQQKIDWSRLAASLAGLASESLGLAADHSILTGMHVYTSYDPNSGNFGHRDWVRGFLENVPGVTAYCLERRRRWAPRCHSCRYEVARCPQCGASMAGTVEKGVDIFLATDLVSMAWSDALDIAVLVSSDGDFVPSVERIRGIPKLVIQARFAPAGAALASACDASLDLTPRLQEILRP